MEVTLVHPDAPELEFKPSSAIELAAYKAQGFVEKGSLAPAQETATEDSSKVAEELTKLKAENKALKSENTKLKNKLAKVGVDGDGLPENEEPSSDSAEFEVNPENEEETK